MIAKSKWCSDSLNLEDRKFYPIVFRLSGAPTNTPLTDRAAFSILGSDLQLQHEQGCSKRVDRVDNVQRSLRVQGPQPKWYHWLGGAQCSLSIGPRGSCYACEQEITVLFNDAINTFYLRVYGVKDHSDTEKGNPLPPHRLLLSINSKGSFICTIPQTG